MDRKGKIKLNDVIAVTITMVVALLVMAGYKYLPHSKTTYTVQNGSIENYSETEGFVVKSEKVLDIKSSDTVIPNVAQSQRVSKDQIVAMYQNNSYDDYQNKINQMDTEIADAIKDLPQSYSSDVANIDGQIQTLADKLKGTTSYIKIQEYKNNIDALAYKKVMVIGELSPAGSTVKDLISKRNQYEQDSKKNALNIKAPVGGAISYKIDNLENVADINKILSYSTSDFDNIFTKYNNKKDSNFGIKVVDNYDAYIVVKEKKGQNDKYIIEGVNYDILLTDSNYTLTAKLVKKIQTQDTYYCIFEVKNGIENLTDSRIVDIKVSWYKVSGMMVPKKDLIDVNNVTYIKVIKNGEYLDIPVKIVIESDNMCIVKNLDDDQKKESNITSNYTLDLYDRVIE